jgi:CBS domain-containing protein
MQDLPIRRIMSTSLVKVSPADTLLSASLLMESRRVHHALVLEGDRLVGILSSADLLKLALLRPAGADDTLSASDEQLDLRVRDVMPRGLVSIYDNQGLRDAALALSIGGYHALPVLAFDGTPVGIVTTTDLAHLLLERIGGAAPPAAAARDAGHAALLDVLHAAEAYLHSGQSATQHARLLRAVERAQEHGGSAPLALSA